jgi:hypothetical protein
MFPMAWFSLDPDFMTRIQDSLANLPALPDISGGLRHLVGRVAPPPPSPWLDGRTALGLGLVLGVGAALLLAPQSGRAQRRDLADRLARLRDEARTFVDRTFTSVRRPADGPTEPAV